MWRLWIEAEWRRKETIKPLKWKTKKLSLRKEDENSGDFGPKKSAENLIPSIMGIIEVEE